jgi:hypothetical protein
MLNMAKKYSKSMMTIMDLFIRTPSPTIAQRESPYSGYPYYDYCSPLPGVEPMTIRLQTGSSNNPLMPGIIMLNMALY